MKKIAKEDVLILMLDKNRIDINKYREIKRHYYLRFSFLEGGTAKVAPLYYSYSIDYMNNRYLITVENDTSVLSAYEGKI